MNQIMVSLFLALMYTDTMIFLGQGIRKILQKSSLWSQPHPDNLVRDDLNFYLGFAVRKIIGLIVLIVGYYGFKVFLFNFR
ncbi:hypothetical protein D3C81_1371570 [compost metagenome]